MKTRIFIIVLSMFLPGLMAAQTSIGPNVWLGTGFGPAGDWENPTNWSKGHVPTETEGALIPALDNKGKAIYPRITGEVEIAQLILHPGANLKIEKTGVLMVDTAPQSVDELTSQIQNQGVLLIADAEMPVRPKAPRYRMGFKAHHQ